MAGWVEKTARSFLWKLRPVGSVWFAVDARKIAFGKIRRRKAPTFFHFVAIKKRLPHTLVHFVVNGTHPSRKLVSRTDPWWVAFQLFSGSIGTVWARIYVRHSVHEGAHTFLFVWCGMVRVMSS